MSYRVVLVALLGCGLLGCDDENASGDSGVRPDAPPAFDGGGQVADGGPDADFDAGPPDTQPPETTLTEVPSSPSGQAEATFEFTADEPATFQCSLDGAPLAACTSPHTVTVSDGAHAFAVVATDTAGNVDASPATHAWVVDLTAPQTTITKAPVTPLDNSVNTSFEFTADEPATFQCSLDGAPLATCSSPHPLNGLADGPHTFSVVATDAVGNVDPTPATHSWSIDSSTPDTTITSGPSGSVASASATFTFTSPEPGATFECKLDTAPFTGCTSPRSFAGLTAGEHTFQVRARDTGGNLDPSPASRTWTVDLTPPNTTITVGPSGTVPVASSIFEFTASEAGATFECRLDGAAFTACTTPLTFASLGQGMHTFDVRARDAAGNVDASPASRTWTVDTVAPETAITGGPTGTVASTSATLTFTSTETPATFECSLDGAAFVACTTPRTLTGLAPGPHTFAVRAKDGVGNTDASPAMRTWTVDVAPPDTTITSGPSGLVDVNTATITFTATEAGSTFECSLDGAAFTACTTPRTLTGLAQGAHTFAVRARDAVGNLDATPASISWTVDSQAPAVSVTSGPSGPTTDTTPAFGFSANEAVDFECRIDGATFAACGTGTTGTFTAATLAQGSHTFEVRGTDAAGNVGSDSQAFSVDTAAPDTTITAGPTGTVNETSATFSFTGSPAGDVASFQCRVDTAAFAACTSPHTVTVGAGDHTFEVRARDALGNVDPTPASRDWTVDNVAPNTTITSGPSGLVDVTTATITFTATEPGSSFECNLDGAGFTACTTPRTLTGLGQGAHTFAVRATDAAGNTDATPASISWTVDSQAPTVSVTSGPTGPTTDTTPAFGFTSSEAVTFECRVDSASFVACGTGTSGTFTAAALGQGAHTFEVRGTDAAGNLGSDSQSFSVDTVAPDTTITAGPTGTVDETTATFSFTGSPVADVASFQCRVDSAAFAACTSPHTVSVGPGSHTFEVRARDALGNADATPASRAWTVDDAAPTVAITGGPTGTTTDTTPTFSFTASESVTFACRFGTSGAFTACGSGTSGSFTAGAALGQGTQTFQVQGTDTAANVGSDSQVFTVDTVPPDTSITGGPTGTINTTSATFTFTGSPAGDVAGFDCSLDGAAFVACTSPRALTGLGEGAHTFAVRARDAVGNLDASPDSQAFTVDTTAPDTIITLAPSSPYPVDYADFTFVASPATGATFQCSIGTAAFTTCTTPFTAENVGYGTGRSFRVRARDAAGNVDATPAQATWTTTRGLVLYYPILDKDLQNYSRLGSRHDGQADGGSFVTGLFGHAIFDGRARGVETVRPMANDSTYTVSVWFNSNLTPASGEFEVFDFEQPGAGGCKAILFPDEGGRTLRVSCSGKDGFSESRDLSVFSESGPWHNVLLRYDAPSEDVGGPVEIFFDGSQYSSISNEGNAPIFTPEQLKELELGADSTSGNLLVDEVRVYNRVFENVEQCELVLGGDWNGEGCRLPRPELHYTADGKLDNDGSLGFISMTGTALSTVAGVLVTAIRQTGQSSLFFLATGGPNGIWPGYGPNWTIGTWFREPGAIINRAMLFDFRGENGISVDHPADDEPRWRVCFTSTTSTQCGFVNYTPGVWNHFAIRHMADFGAGGPLEVFLNGKPELVIDNPGDGVIFSQLTAANTRLGGVGSIDLDDFRAYGLYLDDERMCTGLLAGVFDGGNCKFNAP